MIRKTVVLGIAAFTLTVSACANIMVPLGLQEAPIPVTDSAYFNKQVDTLVERLRANQTRNFRKAAILEFINSDGQISGLGKYLTVKVSERAVAKGIFRVTPSGQVGEALRKLKIKNNGKLTKEQLAAIGSELAIDAVIIGIVSDLQKGSDIDLNIKAIQASSGELLSAASVNIYRSKQVQSLIQQF